MVEVHPHPDDALSDAEQQLDLDQFRDMMAALVAGEREAVGVGEDEIDDHQARSLVGVDGQGQDIGIDVGAVAVAITITVSAIVPSASSSRSGAIFTTIGTRFASPTRAVATPSSSRARFWPLRP